MELLVVSLSGRKDSKSSFTTEGSPYNYHEALKKLVNVSCGTNFALSDLSNFIIYAQHTYNKGVFRWKTSSWNLHMVETGGLHLKD